MTLYSSSTSMSLNTSTSMSLNTSTSMSVNTEAVQVSIPPLAQNGEVQVNILSPSAFKIVVSQTFLATERNTPNSLEKHPFKPKWSQGFRSRSPNPSRGFVEEEEKKSPPELSAVVSRSFKPHTHASSNTLGAELNPQYQLQENALKNMDDGLLGLNVSYDVFEKQLDDLSKIVTVGLNDFKFVDSKLNNILIKREVGRELGVAINCFDPQGNVLAGGLGVFDDFEIDQFLNRHHKSKFREFLQTAFRTKTHVMILIAGMHDRKKYTALKEEIKKYHPTKFLVLLNPWRVPENAKERPDYELLEEYLRGELGCTFKIINKGGQVFLADESLDAIEDYIKFNENAFEIWKNSLQNPLASKNNREHHYKVMRLTEFIYRNRKFYGHKSKIRMLRDLCFEKKLILEDILRDSKAFGYFLNSERLRKVIYYFVVTKLTSPISIHHGLYRETKQKILEFSAGKFMRWLDKHPKIPPKIVKKHFEDIFPGTFDELFAIESVRLWLQSDSGKAAMDAISYFYSASPVDV